MAGRLAAAGCPSAAGTCAARPRERHISAAPRLKAAAEAQGSRWPYRPRSPRVPLNPPAQGAAGPRLGKMLQSLAGSSCVRLVEQHRSAWCFALLVLGYLLYLVFGAVVFSSVELPYEDLLRQELGKLKQRFLEEHACLSEQQLEQFLLRVLEASNYGVSVLSNASGNWNWDFTSSLFFASTVLSTTGKRTAGKRRPSGEAQTPSGPPGRRWGWCGAAFLSSGACD